MLECFCKLGYLLRGFLNSSNSSFSVNSNLWSTWWPPFPRDIQPAKCAPVTVLLVASQCLSTSLSCAQCGLLNKISFFKRTMPLLLRLVWYFSNVIVGSVTLFLINLSFPYFDKKGIDLNSCSLSSSHDASPSSTVLRFFSNWDLLFCLYKECTPIIPLPLLHAFFRFIITFSFP